MEISTEFANFLSVYAPTLRSSKEVKDEFYETQEETAPQIPLTKASICRAIPTHALDPTGKHDPPVLATLVLAS